MIEFIEFPIPFPALISSLTPPINPTDIESNNNAIIKMAPTFRIIELEVIQVIILVFYFI